MENPDVVIIDMLEAIERLHNLHLCLEVVKELKILEGTESFGSGSKLLFMNRNRYSKVLDELNFPVIAKPLVADGSANSHTMSLVFNGEGLKKLTTPIVLQEFVNHGGVIFKVSWLKNRLVEDAGGDVVVDDLEEAELNDGTPNLVEDKGAIVVKVG